MRDVFVLHGTMGPNAEPFGCTWIRLLLPFGHPSLERRVRLRHGGALPPPGEDPDVVVVERHVHDATTLEEAEAIVEELGRRRVPYLHTLDDNLLDLHDEAFGSAERAERVRRVVRHFARHARGVIASTEPLAERMRRLNPNVSVVPNALDERLFPEPIPEPSGGGPLTIGYMGTLTHLDDLMLVLAPLRAAMRRHGARLELVGVSSDPVLPALFDGLPLRLLNPGADASYPRFPGFLRRAARWDLAIAPLVDDPFTRCKSDIKLLDYAALGVPGIYSDVPAYRESVRDGETGLLVPNEPYAWEGALERMLGDGGLRDRARGASAHWLRTSRVLARRAEVWSRSLSALLAT